MQVKDAVIKFESKMIALRKKADGDELVLFIHLDEPDRRFLWDCHLTTRFQCALVEIGDNEEPVVPERSREEKTAVSVAGQMCRESPFQRWLTEKYSYPEDRIYSFDEESTANLLRNILMISSRSELAEDEDARNMFREIIREYNEHRKSGG